MSFRGEKIGKISNNKLAANTGWDIAEVSLEPGVSVQSSDADFSYTPRMGDAVAKIGRTTGQTSGKVDIPNVTEDDSTAFGTTYRVKTWHAALPSQQGDSGGPVLHNGKVVGIVQGGNTADSTTVTPLSAL